jgi:hypothetical protein
MARPDFAPKIDDALVARYEELRSQVMGGLGNGMGLALFVRQGMRSWIEAWRYCTLGTPPAQPQPEPALPAPLRTELTLLLASMVLLNHKMEVVR